MTKTCKIRNNEVTLSDTEISGKTSLLKKILKAAYAKHPLLSPICAPDSFDGVCTADFFREGEAYLVFRVAREMASK